MNELQVFNYNGSQVRTVEKGGSPWWVLKDVCDILGLGTPARVAERLDEDEVSQTHLTDNLGRQQKTTIINESGLYNVILRSDKPEAKPFRKWVTAEVLPSIRKTGSYSVNSKPIETPEYNFTDKTWRGEKVMALTDFEYFTGVRSDAVRSRLRNICNDGADYVKLVGSELCEFKLENPGIDKKCNALILLKAPAVRKLMTYYNIKGKLPLPVEEKKPAPPVVLNVTVPEPKRVNSDECIVALNVLRWIRSGAERHKERSKQLGYFDMVEQFDKEISTLNDIMKKVGGLISCGA